MADAKRCDACKTFYMESELNEQQHEVYPVNGERMDLCNNCNYKLEEVLAGHKIPGEGTIILETEEIAEEAKIPRQELTYDKKEREARGRQTKTGPEKLRAGIIAAVRKLCGAPKTKIHKHVYHLSSDYNRLKLHLNELVQEQVLYQVQNYYFLTEDKLRAEADNKAKETINRYAGEESTYKSNTSTSKQGVEDMGVVPVRENKHGRIVQTTEEEEMQKLEDDLPTRNPFNKEKESKQTLRQRWIVTEAAKMIKTGMSRSESMKNANAQWEDLAQDEKESILGGAA